MSSGPGDRRVNLLIVTNGLGFGGAEVVIQRLVESIDRKRFNVLVCCLRERGPIGDRLAHAGTEVIELKRPGRAQAAGLSFLKLRRVIRSRRIDVVHTHTTGALSAAALCKLALTRFRLVHTFHYGNYPHRPRKQMWFEKFGTLLADLLVAVGDRQRGQLLSAFALKEDRVARVWNGVAFSPAAGGDAMHERLRGNARILVGTIATLIEQKGLFDLLEVARRLRNRCSGLRFVVIGDGALRPRLEAARRDLGLEEIVNFAGWIPDAARSGLPAFDIFFLPSLWEAMSIALLEAMAAGKAVVATRVGEAPHMLREGIDGFLVEPHDIDGMCAAIARLADDVELRHRLGRSAEEAATTRFAVEPMARAYEEIYLARR